MKIQNVQLNWENLNIRLRKMAQRAVCCCTTHVNVDYLQKAAIRYCQIIGQDPTTISCNEKLCDEILCEEPNIKCYHWKFTDCKAKSLTWLKNLKCGSKCYVENVDCDAQYHIINIHKDIFACLFSIHNTISLSCHEQVSLSGLLFERYFSHHRAR